MTVVVIFKLAMADKCKGVSTSSEPEEGDDKRAKVEMEMPSWARDLVAQITESNRKSTEEIKATVNELKQDIVAIKESVAKVEQRCDNMEEKNFETSSEVYELRQKVEKLEFDLADQTDRGLRNHLSVHNIPLTKPRETWDSAR